MMHVGNSKGSARDLWLIAWASLGLVIAFGSGVVASGLGSASIDGVYHRGLAPRSVPGGNAVVGPAPGNPVLLGPGEPVSSGDDAEEAGMIRKRSMTKGQRAK
jgi:hypothetical protein